MTAPRKRATKSPEKRVDTRSHALSVFDGAIRAGSLVERGGEFLAFDLDGRHLGAFPDMRTASRSIPPAEAR
jgi:hypothetical protein